MDTTMTFNPTSTVTVNSTVAVSCMELSTIISCPSSSVQVDNGDHKPKPKPQPQCKPETEAKPTPQSEPKPVFVML